MVAGKDQPYVFQKTKIVMKETKRGNRRECSNTQCMMKKRERKKIEKLSGTAGVYIHSNGVQASSRDGDGSRQTGRCGACDEGKDGHPGIGRSLPLFLFGRL